MGSKDNRSAFITASIFLFLLITTPAVFLAWATYEECRRVHPIWYCIQ